MMRVGGRASPRDHTPGKAGSIPAPATRRAGPAHSEPVARRADWRVAVCVASGPSRSAGESAIIREARAADLCRVIAINREWEWLPNADALYAADAKFWRMYGRRIAAEFPAERWTASDQTPAECGARFIRIRGLPGLSRDPACVHGGQNGGYQAIGLAYHLGAREIILVGYDMQRGPKGEAHHFGDHPRELGQAANPAAWVANFDRLSADLAREGVRVTNCTPRSALTQFPTGDLAETLRGAPRLPAAA